MEEKNIQQPQLVSQEQTQNSQPPPVVPDWFESNSVQNSETIKALVGERLSASSNQQNNLETK
jgi:hypothetical protein